MQFGNHLRGLYLSPKYQQKRKVTDEQERSEDSVITSMSVAAASGSATVGAIVGGNIIGAVVGEALINESTYDVSYESSMDIDFDWD